MYGQIFRDVQIPSGATVPLGGVGGPTIGVADYCTFLTQDITDGGGFFAISPNVLPGLAYVDGTTRNAGVCNVVSPPAGIPEIVDALLVAPHSIIDAGPIVPMTAPGMSARTAATTRRGRAPSYRSLHHVQATAAVPSVIVLHNLGTDAVLPFAQPLALPVDPAGGGTPLIWWFTLGVGAVTLNVALAGGGPITAPIDFDVMVVSARAVGHTMFQHNPAALAARPSYQAMNVFAGTAGGPPVGTLTHNLNAQNAPITTPPGSLAADAIALFSFVAAPPAFAPDAFGITSRNVAGGAPNGATTISIQSVIAPIGANAAVAAVFRVHSMIVRP